MLGWKKRIRKTSYLLADIMTIITSFFLSRTLFVYYYNQDLDVTFLEQWGLVSIFVLSLIGAFLSLRIYEITIEKAGKIDAHLFIRMSVSYCVAVLVSGTIMYFGKVSLSRLFFIEFLLITILLIRLIRFFLRKLLFIKSSVSTAHKNIVILGYSRKGQEYIKEIHKQEYLNISVVGYVHIGEPRLYEGVKHLGDIEMLNEIAKDHIIDEIAVARPLEYDSRIEALLNSCQSMGITITMLLNVNNTRLSKAHVAMVGDIPVLKLHTVSLDEGQLMAKRVLDVVGAMFGFGVFLIAYVIIGPLIKLETPGPIIFKQNRVGLNGRIFKVWKFRSMGVDAEKQKAALMNNNEVDGHMFKMSNDPRVTKIGKFIRKMSIDELPQFYNVLVGDMSLVGTRPPTIDEVKEYTNYHHSRISIVPGITGNWQISGRSDITDFEEVVRLDLDYISNWSVWLDIRILFKTLRVVLLRKGSK